MKFKNGLSLLRTNVNSVFRSRDQFDMIVMLLVFVYLYRRLRRFLRFIETESPIEYLKDLAFSYARLIPSIRDKLERTLAESRTLIEHSVKEYQIRRFEHLPPVGHTSQQVIDWIESDSSKEHELSTSGKLSGTVYHGGQEMAEMFGRLYPRFTISNPLHSDVFCHSRQLEAEVIRMVANMYNGDSASCGVMTSGGTESIIMAVKAYRDRGRSKGITEPNICVPISAHAAFVKAGQYFNVAVKLIPVDADTSQVCIKSMRRAINSRTVAIVGSCPSFPHGTVDPIEALSILAESWGIGFHVDACLGGFIVPFMEECGFPLPLFDFRLPGVTTISCDVHKYGFAPKGASVLLYRNKEWRQYQYSFMSKWQGGIYATPGMAGSRNGAMAVMSWAAMVKMGRDGYLNATRTIISATRKVSEGIQDIANVCVVGRPDVSVVAFAFVQNERIDDCRTYGLNDALKERGWVLNALQHPPSLHLCLTLPTAPHADAFLLDLQDSVAAVRNDTSGKYTKGTTAGLYGSTMSIPVSIVEEACGTYLDVASES